MSRDRVELCRETRHCRLREDIDRTGPGTAHAERRSAREIGPTRSERREAGCRRIHLRTHETAHPGVDTYHLEMGGLSTWNS
jgi:hypothetical protein